MQTKALVIVGHGHSMTESGLGETIDSLPVVRMKVSKRLVDHSPEDYGTRTDYAGSTTAVIGGVMTQYPDAKEYWCYIKAKRKNAPDDRDMIQTGEHVYKGRKVFFYVPSEVHFKWLDRYYEIRGNDNLRYSTGMGMIIAALERLNPKKLYLAGMDSILDPQGTDWSSTLATKEYDWEKEPPHDFNAENKLFEEVKRHYKTTTIEKLDGNTILETLQRS